jgi:hypothetical protein
VYQGREYAIHSVDKGLASELSYSGQGERAVWTVKLKWDGEKASPDNSYTATNSRRELLVVSDEKGQPYTQDESERMSQHSSSPQRHSLWGAMGGTSTRSNGWIYIAMFIDPAKVASLRIYALIHKSIDITGIPMDPRN